MPSSSTAAVRTASARRSRSVSAGSGSPPGEARRRARRAAARFTGRPSPEGPQAAGGAADVPGGQGRRVVPEEAHELGGRAGEDRGGPRGVVLRGGEHVEGLRE